MADSQRIDDLRRRVQKDPASIAFAQLAEECRRAGQAEEAVDVCRAGLAIHPGYLSARVTLGRALIELNALDDALDELTTVLRGAPENLAAISRRRWRSIAWRSPSRATTRICSRPLRSSHGRWSRRPPRLRSRGSRSRRSRTSS